MRDPNVIFTANGVDYRLVTGTEGPMPRPVFLRRAGALYGPNDRLPFGGTARQYVKAWLCHALPIEWSQLRRNAMRVGLARAFLSQL